MIDELVGRFFNMVMREPRAAFERALSRPFKAQNEALRRILAFNRKTKFGQKSGFKALLGAGDDLWLRYRKAIPIRSYDDFEPDIEWMKQGDRDVLIPDLPEMFSLTSGTTARPKFCPVNRAFTKEHHRQHLLWMHQIHLDHPRANSGKYLTVASPAWIGRTAGGIPYGAMSGKQLESQSIPVRRRAAVPALVQHFPDPEDRWFYFLLFALAEEDIRVVTAVNPSSLVAIGQRLQRDTDRFLERLENGLAPAGRSRGHAMSDILARSFRAKPDRVRRLREIIRVDGSLSPGAVWPNLEILLTWQGGSSAFYLPHVETLWGSLPKRCLGLRASEGTFSIPLRDNDPAGTLAVGGHAMEFLPAEAGDPEPFSPTLLVGELEQDRLYRLVVTTSGGFYRYDMGDLVRVVGFNKNVPEVVFERRAGAILSATGEKVTEDQVAAAMTRASAEGPLLNGFTLTWEMEGAEVRYVLALEPAGGPEYLLRRRSFMARRLKELVDTFDHELSRQNVEYKSKREDGRLGVPRVILLEAGTYDNFRLAAARQGRPESQVKPPVMVAPPGPGRAPVRGCPFFDRARIVEMEGREAPHSDTKVFSERV